MDLRKEDFSLALEMTIFRVIKHSLRSGLAGVMARVEGLRGMNSPVEAREAGRQVNGLFESLLSESFGE